MPTACPMRSGNGRRQQGGFVYIALLIGMAIIGIGLGTVSEVWTQSRQREKEEELLFVGDQFRIAITRFYQQSPPAARRFPNTLEELLEDNRNPDKPMRHLRRLYADPITQTTRWGEVRLPGGQLVGVYSESADAPLKTAGFALKNKDFADQTHYSDWVFRSALPAANPNLAAGGGFNTNGAAGSPAAPPRTTPAPNQRPPAPPPAGAILPAPRAR